MRFQWSFLIALLFALIVALFALANTNAVTLNYLFGSTSIPLVLIILGAALGGAISVGLFGLYRQYRMQSEIKRLKKELASKEGDMNRTVTKQNVPPAERAERQAPGTATESAPETKK